MNPGMGDGASDSEEELTKAQGVDGLHKDQQREGVSREKKLGPGMQRVEECEGKGQRKKKMKRREEKVERRDVGENWV